MLEKLRRFGRSALVAPSEEEYCERNPRNSHQRISANFFTRDPAIHVNECCHLFQRVIESSMSSRLVAQGGRRGSFVGGMFKAKLKRPRSVRGLSFALQGPSALRSRSLLIHALAKRHAAEFGIRRLFFVEVCRQKPDNVFVA
jgi:hypothetical protein